MSENDALLYLDEKGQGMALVCVGGRGDNTLV